MKRLALVTILLSASARPADAAPTVPDPVTMPEIKAYCLDFNWQGSGRKKKIADPGFMKGANPELSYGLGGYHLPYTDEYLAYLTAAITDAVKTTGIDGFMIDWIWQPSRKATEGKWLDAEKKLYQQLMAPKWPATRLRLYWRENQAANAARMRITNASIACEFPLEKDAAITWGTTGNLLLGDDWTFTANKDDGGTETKTASVRRTPEVIEVDLPEAFIEGNPEAITYEWLK